MRICLVHEEFPEETNFGGIATYQKNVAEELVKLGNIVYVICRGLKSNYKYEENGVKIIRVYVKPTGNQEKDYINYRQKVANILSELQDEKLIDIIETPDWGAETIFFEEKRRIPLIVRLHTPLKIWLKFNKNNFGPIKNKMLEWENKMINSADLVTCCSNALKNMVVKNFSIKPSKILVTPNPANLSNFYYDKNIKKENQIIYVGSLEQRKGICILAKSLNYVFKKYPDLKIKFIGKDTNRNYKNISTINLIYELIKKEYHKNIEFLGQISNSEINTHLNRSLVGVFPSLFDNFPYVVLEAMAAGLHIVGSENSGMVEMLNDKDSIYNTGDVRNLSLKIIEKYELSLKNNISRHNMRRVNQCYNPTKVCNDLLTLYKKTYNKFYNSKNTLFDIQNILEKVSSEKIVTIKHEKGGIANIVYRVTTLNHTFIIKKYNYNYDFILSNKLHKIYNKNNIKTIKPINNKPILYKSYYYNIFEYVKNNKLKKIDDDYFIRLLCCDRKTNSEDMLLKKCNDYYYKLKKITEYEGLDYENVEYVLNKYRRLKRIKLKYSNYINHGDIQENNIIKNKNGIYLIDFDEVIVTSCLYDFAIIFVKMFMKDGKINPIKFEKYKKILNSKYETLKNEDFYNIIRLYLCKILLEKYYLHAIGKINLNSKNQKKDDYLKYLKYLKKLDKDGLNG